MTHPWAAEGAGGESGRGSANRPRPVATNMQERDHFEAQRLYRRHVSASADAGSTERHTESTTAMVAVTLSAALAVKPSASAATHTKWVKKAARHSDSTG